jgi:hypothetical protein
VISAADSLDAYSLTKTQSTGTTSMRKFSYAMLLGISVAGVAAGIVGCGSSESTQFAAVRKVVLLTEKPSELQSFAEAKEHVADNPSVTIRGKIAAGDFDPFEANKSIFTITEIPAESHEGEPGHDADNCPFCKRRAKDAPMALVRVSDEQGNLFPFSAANILGLRKDQVVIVQGKAEYKSDLDLFTIDAKKLFIQESK